MTQDEIIEMARQAGIDVGIWEKLYDDDIFGYSIGGIHENLEAFAKLVAAKERDACAKVCDELSKKHSWEGCYANECAEAIRARGTHENN